MSRSRFVLLALGILALSLPAAADNIGLADWCTNLNGSLAVCNGGPSAISSAVDTHRFDHTIEGGDPTATRNQNSLGKIVFHIGTGQQYASVYMDYDVKYFAPDCGGGGCLSNDDYAGTQGTPPPEASYQVGAPDPSFAVPGSTGMNFSNGTLDNTNHVPASLCQANGTSECDVAWAMAISLFVHPVLYSGGTVTFTVSTERPASGFYLIQSNDDPLRIYLSESVQLNPVPEPSAVILLLTISGLLFVGRKWMGKVPRTAS